MGSAKRPIDSSRQAKTAFVDWMVGTLEEKAILRGEVKITQTGRIQFSIISVLYLVPDTNQPTLGEVRLSTKNDEGLRVLIDEKKDIGLACAAKADWFANNGYGLWLEDDCNFITVNNNGTKRSATHLEGVNLYDAMLDVLFAHVEATADLCQDQGMEKILHILNWNFPTLTNAVP